MGKHAIQCLSHATYHNCFFNMACMGGWRHNCAPFPFRPAFEIHLFKATAKESVQDIFFYQGFLSLNIHKSQDSRVRGDHS